MGKPKRIPITAAKEIAKKYGYEQVIITGFNSTESIAYHVTTYGVNKEHCKQAEQGGNFIRKAIGGKWIKDNFKD